MPATELHRFPKQTVPFTNGATALSGGTAMKIGNRYGRIVDNVAASGLGSIQIRGHFSITKATTADTWNDGDDLEWAVSNTGVLTIQKYVQGVKAGKAYGASLGTDTEAGIELMPELN